MEYLQTWLHNFSGIPARWMARYLEKRGWVVFYLDEHARSCGNNGDGCWLALYQSIKHNA